MRRNVTLAVLLVSTGLLGLRYASAGQAPRPRQTPTFPSAIKIASTPPNNIPTPSPSPIPSTTSSLAPSALAIRCLPILVRFTRASCWCTAWGFHPIIALSPLLQLVRMR
jgi:hypothetical protein